MRTRRGLRRELLRWRDLVGARAAGYDVWYMNCLNEGHGFRKKENRDLYQQIVIMFLEKHLAD